MENNPCSNVANVARPRWSSSHSSIGVAIVAGGMHYIFELQDLGLAPNALENNPGSNVANSILCRFDRRSSSRTPGAALELAACRGSPRSYCSAPQRYRYLQVPTALVYLHCEIQSRESPGKCHHSHQTLLLHGHASKVLASYFRYFRSSTPWQTTRHEYATTCSASFSPPIRQG